MFSGPPVIQGRRGHGVKRGYATEKPGPPRPSCFVGIEGFLRVGNGGRIGGWEVEEVQRFPELTPGTQAGDLTLGPCPLGLSNSL